MHGGSHLKKLLHHATVGERKDLRVYFIHLLKRLLAHPRVVLVPRHDALSPEHTLNLLWELLLSQFCPAPKTFLE